jgi:hypothetical protein
VRHEIGRAQVRGEGVVLRHVADELADLGPLACGVESHDDGATARRGEQSQEDLEQGRLAGAVRADETDDAGFDIEREAVEGGDVLVALGQAVEADQRDVRAQGDERLGRHVP